MAVMLQIGTYLLSLFSLLIYFVSFCIHIVYVDKFINNISRALRNLSLAPLIVVKISTDFNGASISSH